MMNMSKYFVGLEDTKLKAGVEESNKTRPVDLPCWVKDVKANRELDIDYTELDKPLFK